MKQFDPTSTDLHPLAEYSDRLPSSRPGKRIHRATLWRWALKGARGVVLRTVLLGGCRYTCDAYVAEFMRELSSTPGRSPGPVAFSPADAARISKRFGVSEPTCT